MAYAANMVERNHQSMNQPSLFSKHCPLLPFIHASDKHTPSPSTVTKTLTSFHVAHHSHRTYTRTAQVYAHRLAITQNA